MLKYIEETPIDELTKELKYHGVEFEVNWNDVKRGTKIKYVYDKLMNGMIEHITKTTFEITNKSYTNLYTDGKFYDFVSETNQVLILVGDSVIVKNASEVELV